MTQKQALEQVLESLEFVGEDSSTTTTLRALFVIRWLEDMNWHPEAAALAERTEATPYVSIAFRNVMRREPRNMQTKISFLNHLFNFGLARTDWKSTKGEALVAELWEIISSPKRPGSEAGELGKATAAELSD